VSWSVESSEPLVTLNPGQGSTTCPGGTVVLTAEVDPQTSLGPVTLTATGNSSLGAACSSSVATLAVELIVDLDVEGVDEELEEDPGRFIWVNDDDDDENGTPDKDDTGATAGEDDLVGLAVTADGSMVGTLTLQVVSGATRIRVYENANRSNPVTLPQSWELDGLLKTFTVTYYVEGVVASTSVRDVELALTLDGPGVNCEDKVKLTVLDVEIEINNTVAQNDDAVRVKSDVPVSRPTIPSRARLLGPPPGDVLLVLTNPDARLRFPEATDTTKTLVLPQTGAWTAFEISGESPSMALDDALIVAHLDSATGSERGTENVTVFSFDPSSITVTAAGNYVGADTTNGPQYTTINGPAVRFSAEGTLNPAGLDCAIPQITDLRIGIMQNSTLMEHAITYNLPGILWHGGVPAGTVVTVPSTLRRAFTVAGVRNDSRPFVAPLYDRSGQPNTYDENSLKPPIGCPGGAAATTEDTPWVPFPAALPSMDVLDTEGNVVGDVFYMRRVNATLNDSFRTWVVCFDTLTNEVIPLRETTWVLDVAFASLEIQQADPSGSDADPTNTPIEAPPFTNTELNDPANQTDAGVGPETTTFVHP